MICEIISVGTEVVTGDIVDTNAPFIAKELVHLGIDTMYRTQVRDDEATLNEVLEIAKKRADCERAGRKQNEIHGEGETERGRELLELYTQSGMRRKIALQRTIRVVLPKREYESENKENRRNS